MQANSTVCSQAMVMNFLAASQEAAVASFPWVGKRNKQEADRAGTEAMRNRLNQVDMNGVVVIGEGEMDQAPMLYINERLGTGEGPEVDIAVDPVEGTTLMAKGQDGSLAVIAAADKGSLLHAPDMYMKKLAVGPKAKGRIDIHLSLTENMVSVADALGKQIGELTIMIQDRPRHKELINEVLAAGARIRLFSDVDITGALASALDHLDVDMLAGIGGAPEGVIAAAALKCLGGDFQGVLVPQNGEEWDRCVGMGIAEPDKALKIDEIVKSDECFFVATGITSGLLLNGVEEKEDGSMQTHSLVIHGGESRSFQFIESRFFR